MSITSNTAQVMVNSQQQCPCGSVLVGGECQQLIPASIQMSALVQKYPFWLVYDNCDGGGCTAFEGENLAKCNFGYGLCNDKNYTFSIKGQVVDAGGHPVCGVSLTFSGSLNGAISGTIPWVTSNEQDQGEYIIDSAVPSETDSNGNFTINYTVVIHLTSVKGCTPFVTPTQFVDTNPVSWSVTVALTGYPDVPSSTVVIEMNNTICEENLV